MKNRIKLVAFAIFAFAFTTTVLAQNKFIGTVKYSIEAAGKTEELTLKVYENNAMFKTEASQVLVKGRKLYTPQDFSQYISFLKTNDVWDSPYEGDGKILIKQELEQKDIDSLTIPCTEGFYFEYIDGETKEIAGQKAKKARYHLFNDEGEDKGFEVWYTDEIGPEYDLILLMGLKGLPLEFVITSEDGSSVTYKATEIKKERLKDAEFLLPAGYAELPEEELKGIIQAIQEGMELLDM
ncbi:MAG: hypothetical protein IKY79_01945 [Bacteroidales bacterium]|nr:hypothetical protein [Bacteroidales bacterium]